MQVVCKSAAPNENQKSSEKEITAQPSTPGVARSQGWKIRIDLSTEHVKGRCDVYHLLMKLESPQKKKIP